MKYQNERLKKVETIEKFVYNPNGNNPEYNALNHAEVIKIKLILLLKRYLILQLIGVLR